MLLSSMDNARICPLACVLFLAAPALAASFDCAKARTPQEKAICASPELSAADDKMAAAYRRIFRSVPPAFQNELRADQRVWIRRLSIACPADNPEQRQYLQQCLLWRENARTSALQQRFLRQNGIVFAWHSVFREDPGEPGAADPGEGPGSLEASWPEALSASPQWRAWNDAMTNKTRKFASLDPPNTPPSDAKTWEAAPGQDLDVTASIDFADSRLVAVTITILWDGHGAHPSTHWIQFNWLLEKKRALQPTDIFRADSKWADLLYSLTDQYLQKALDGYQPAELAATVRAITSDPESWRIDPKGISIVFQQYAVGCYACTPEPFTITWDQLRPVLDPDFPVPPAH